MKSAEYQLILFPLRIFSVFFYCDDLDDHRPQILRQPDGSCYVFTLAH